MLSTGHSATTDTTTKFVAGHFGTNMGQSNLWNVAPNAVAETAKYTIGD